MNNKRLGSLFEKRVCEVLRNDGFWVHFLSPDNRGAQPFDIIAVKDGMAIAIDCKTCKDKTFRINRLEDNQVFAFDYFKECGNYFAYIFIEHMGEIYVLNYSVLATLKKIKIQECRKYDDWIKEMFGARRSNKNED